MSKGDDLVLGGDHPFGGIEIDAAVMSQRHDVDLPAGELPGYDVGMVLELAQQHPALIRPALRDEIDRLGRAAAPSATSAASSSFSCSAASSSPAKASAMNARTSSLFATSGGSPRAAM